MRYLSLALFFFLCLILSAAPAGALDNLTAPFESANPVIIPGKHLGSLSGKEIPLIRVFSIRDGILSPIPFQIDQVDSMGDWVWDIAYEKHLESDYEDNNLEGIGNFKWRVEQRAALMDDEDTGGKKILDANDLLVFMAKDMGSRAPNIHRKLNGAWLILEINIFQASGKSKSWAYIVYYRSDPPAYSPVRYVRYLPDTMKVISPVYEVEFSKEQVAVLEKLEIGSVPLMDRTKLRGSVLIGRKPFVKTFNFSENNIYGHIDGYIDGPVRIIKRNSASLRLGLVFSSPEIHCDQVFYLHHSEIPARLPFNIFMDRVSLLLAADYHNSPFRRAYLGGVRTPIQLQGTSSDTNLLEGLKNVPWMALEGDAATVVSVLTIPEEIEPFARITPYLVHNSNLTDPPETYRGSDPAAGYVIETKPGFPRGIHTIVGTYLYLPRRFLQSDARQILDLAGNEPGYRISDISHMAEIGQ